jgi:rSAM/selenodomain-associated transferase 2/rSAM/selenodomain-associated transferase 1
MKLSLVIPVLDEARSLPARLAALGALRAQGVEVIVVDGGSTDGSWAIARAALGRSVDRLLAAPRGRAAQMNAGAATAGGDVLCFVHADTVLPAQAVSCIRRAMQEHAWGRFDVCIDGQHPLLPVIAALMNLRSRLSGIATGDQAIFVRRALFEQLGGYPVQPLMEDIALSACLRRSGPPACLRTQVLTSGRRWQTRGVLRTVVLMWWLRLAYWRGADPAALAHRYGYRPWNAPPPCDVAVLAKAPQPGFAKTRLMPQLGAAGAARAQRRFTLDTLQAACEASQTLGSSVQLWCAPDGAHRFFRALGLARQSQPEGDIGARMAGVFAAHFSRSTRGLLLVGTDCPLLAPGHLWQAAAALRAHDVVLLPAQDGGYALLGLRAWREAREPLLFDGVRWSTASVMEDTRERAARAGLSWHELPALWDVDCPADWQRWQQWQRAHAPGGLDPLGNPS